MGSSYSNVVEEIQHESNEEATGVDQRPLLEKGNQKGLYLESVAGDLTCGSEDEVICILKDDMMLIMRIDGHILHHVILADITSVFVRRCNRERQVSLDGADSELGGEEEFGDDEQVELVIVSFPLVQETRSCCCTLLCCCCCSPQYVREKREDIVLTSERPELVHHWEYALTSAVSGKGQRDLCISSAKKFFVVICPASGSGNSVKTYERMVRPIFEASRIEATVVCTTKPKDAIRQILRISLKDFDGIVVVGGDGMVFEAIQGLANHPESQGYELRMPIGIIPCGSGNGMVTSLAHVSQSISDAPSSAIAIARGRVEVVDVWHVSTMKKDGSYGAECFACLSFSWAIIADIDIESEKCRCFGGARFTMGSLVRVACLRQYEGRILYLPASADSEDVVSVTETAPATWKEVSGDFTLLWAMNVTHGSSDCFVAPNAKLNNAAIELVLVQGAGRIDMTKGLLGLEHGNHVDLPSFETLSVKAFRLESYTPGDNIPGRLVVDGELLQPAERVQVDASFGSADFFSYH